MLSKNQMVTKIRRMQKEMGVAPTKASLLNIEFTEAEVERIYYDTCRSFNTWQLNHD